MAIDAVDFDGGAGLGVDFAVAVIVLREVAVGALHAFFEMNVREVDGFVEAVGIVEGDLVAVLVEPVPFSIVIEDGAEDPAVAVEVGEFCGVESGVEFGGASLFEEFVVDPKAAGGGGFGIAKVGFVLLRLGGIALLGRIHFVGVEFVVPPGEAEVRGDHVRAGVDVADHALAGGNGASERMFDGMAGLGLVDRGIGGGACAAVAKLCVCGGVRWIVVVGVDDVAGGAAAGAVVAGVIVGAGKRHDRIEEAGFLQAEENGIGAEFSAEAAVGELIVGLAGFFGA